MHAKWAIPGTMVHGSYAWHRWMMIFHMARHILPLTNARVHTHPPSFTPRLPPPAHCVLPPSRIERISPEEVSGLVESVMHWTNVAFFGLAGASLQLVRLGEGERGQERRGAGRRGEGG